MNDGSVFMRDEAPRKGARSERTCVGCGGADEPARLVRLVVAPNGEVAVDLAGGQFGRGAYVHATSRCLMKAPRGLSRSFRREITTSAGDLTSAIVAGAERRAAGLLASAARAKQVEVGAEAAGEAFEAGRAHLLVVARDAAAAASVGRIMHAISKGGAVAWGNKRVLGSLVGREEVAVLGITSQPLSAAIRMAVSMSAGIAAEDG